MVDIQNRIATLVTEPGYEGATALTTSDLDAGDVAAGRGLAVVCTVAGNVKVKLADGSSLTFPVAVGFTVLPFQVVRVFTTGTTATATYSNLA